LEASSVSSNENYARELFELASASRDARRFNEAMERWTQARDFCRLNHLNNAAARCDANLGITWFLAGHPDRPIEQYELAKAQFIRLGMIVDAAQIDENIGKARADVGQHQEAIECYERAKAVFTELGLLEKVAGCDFCIAASLFNGALL
jgi:tetratricopeptide (TPR) repeat protein